MVTRASLITAICLLLGLCIASLTYAQRDWTEDLELFELTRTVTLQGPDSMLIAQVEHMDVDPKGRFLLTDDLSRQVLLFDSDGSLLASLDVSACHPGIAFRPYGARFLGSDLIFVSNSNSGHWGYRFTSDGECVGPSDRQFVSPDCLGAHPGGLLYGVYLFPDPVIRRMDGAGKTLDMLPLPTIKHPNANRRFGGGSLIVDESNLYYVLPIRPEVIKFTLDGTVVGRMSRRSSWFQASPKRDLPADVNQALARINTGEWNSTTFTHGIYELSDQLLMVQYTNDDRGTGYQVFTKDGELVAEELGLWGLFLHVEDELAYRTVQPGLDEHGELPNPVLQVFRFTAP